MICQFSDPFDYSCGFYVVFNTVSLIIVILIIRHKWLAPFVVDLKYILTGRNTTGPTCRVTVEL